MPMPNTVGSALQITLNGQPRAITADMRLEDLVRELKLDTRQIAIERNLAIVPRSAYSATLIADGDRIEIVGFIGGG